jgi:hypothetical protein
MPVTGFSNAENPDGPGGVYIEATNVGVIVSFVMAGHSPSKTGVNALMSRPSTFCRKKNVDARHKAGHDD